MIREKAYRVRTYGWCPYATRKMCPARPRHKGARYPPDIDYSGCGGMLTGGVNGHGGRPRLIAVPHEASVRKTKKAGRFPMRERVGSAKSPIL